jgi:hypothetical protein
MAKLGAGAIAGIAIACVVLGLGGFYKYNTMKTVVNMDNDRNIPVSKVVESFLVVSDDGWKPRVGGSRKHKKQGKPKKARKHSKRR